GVARITSGTAKVTLTDDANGYVIADAVQFVPVADIVVDNGQVDYAETGPWTTGGMAGAGFNGDYRYASSGAGTSVATWTAGNLPSGMYRVEVTWVAGGSRATNAPFAILDGATVRRTARVDQQADPSDDHAHGVGWRSLGVVRINSGSGTVRLANDANGI